MKITKFYSLSTEIEDLSKDKVTISLSWDEYSELRSLIDFARFKTAKKSFEDFHKKLEDEDKKAKTKWVK